MKLGIMQPYLFPYIGYFQLINSVDVFVIYDNVEFVKNGWFHRNRLIFNNKVDYFTVNLKKASDFLDVKEREISSVYFEKELPKTLRKIEQSYRKAPYFESVFPFVKETLEYEEQDLFKYIFNSLEKTLGFLGLSAELIISSSLPLDHTKKNKYRIYEIYHYLKASEYINPIGGHDLYEKEDFKNNNVNLKFLHPKIVEYSQRHKEFVSHLSIIDVLMFNSIEKTTEMLNQYKVK